MLVSDLIKRLHDIPVGWRVVGTGRGSLEVWDPNGVRYGYVFTDDRETRFLTNRTSNPSTPLRTDRTGIVAPPAVPVHQSQASEAA